MRCYHSIVGGAETFVNEGALKHCQERDDQSCWCSPDVLVRCHQCDAAPTKTPKPPEEPWMPPCHACGGYGLIDVTDRIAMVPIGEPLLICHYDR